MAARKETYKHINTVKKQQKRRKKQRASVGYATMLLHAIMQ